MAEVSDGRLRVRVSDSGIGISDEDQERVFAQFFRVESKQTQGVPGTGLGLAIAKSIIDLHGGTISVSSKLGEGTTVEYEVPGVMSGPSDEYMKARAVIPRSRLAVGDDSEEIELSAG